jgi:beta-lactamase superfamily II metal-dependent hydrolase
VTRYYARAEVVDGNGAQVVVLDAIRSDWLGFASGAFALDANMEANDPPAVAFWRRLFMGEAIEGNPLQGAPIVRVELESLPPEWMSVSDSDLEMSWLEFETVKQHGVAGELFEDGDSGLFDSDGQGVMVSVPVLSVFEPALDRIFDMHSWPSASTDRITSQLDGVPAFSQVLAIDVGQGGSNALIDPAGEPQLYFDVGAGMGKHARSTPPDLQFCHCAQAPIILSHWDTDHWAGARVDARLLEHTWIVPRQKIGPTHSKFAIDILVSGGCILICDDPSILNVSLFWQNSRRSAQTPGPDQILTIVPCIGKSRNDSGLALRVRDELRQLDWLLTGDASYDKIPASNSPVEFAAVTASHHGAKQPRVRSLIPTRTIPSNKYARLLYSYATPNKFGHPHPRAVGDSAGQGWRHASSAAPGGPNGLDVLATGTGRGRPSIAAGWRRRPLLPRHLMSCLIGINIQR